MRGAIRVVAMSPEGHIQAFDGTNILIAIKAGGKHWTLHDELHGQLDCIIGVIPNTWSLKLVLP